ncbi:MAG: M28 family peptidase, partial [Bacteroidota bacterium]
METAGWMMDVYGPRLTGSPMLDKATEWAQKTLKDWGMKNVHLESWGPFGRGWEMNHFEMHCSGPSYWPVIAYPKAWSPSVVGKGEVIYLDTETVEDLENSRGKLSGKFVLLDTIRDVKEIFEPGAKRHDAESLLRLANANTPTPRPRRNYNLNGRTYYKALWKFLEDEKPLAVLDRSYKGDLGTVFVSGARTAEGRSREQDKIVIPQLTVSVEHYNRILRNVQRGVSVELSIDLQAEYTNPDGREHNIIAEIPGTDLKDEVVMFGAHFDSWHTATGATDNGAGSTVMMEAARILLATIKESGIKPRRTLRLALWTGEEQGLLGSRGYAKEHFAVFPPDSYTPQSFKPEQEKISGYF